MMDRRILVAIILLLAYISGYAHRYMFKHLEVADGLSSNTVYSIYQDRDGFMWFGTRNGLNRYDGYTFRVFRHLNNDPYSLPDNVVANIL